VGVIRPSKIYRTMGAMIEQFPTCGRLKINRIMKKNKVLTMVSEDLFRLCYKDLSPSSVIFFNFGLDLFRLLDKEKIMVV